MATRSNNTRHRDKDDQARPPGSNNNIKATAFTICSFRTMLSLLPEEAGSIRYDARTPNFEGVALRYRRNKNRDQESDIDTNNGIDECRRAAANFPAFLNRMEKAHGWRGIEFNVCRAHFVDKLIVDSVTNATNQTSPIRQIVFCGIGQDYRGMRYGELIRQYAVTVFELDLPDMMCLREKVKQGILHANPNLILPETHALPIDFGSQHVSEVLLSCRAFDPNVPTLYIWEGVSYYLTSEMMKLFFQDIHQLMRKSTTFHIREQHRLFFDHLIDLPKLVETANDAPAKAMLDRFAESEPLQAFLDFDQVGPYLESLGLSIEKQLCPPDMYKPYQTAGNVAFHLRESKYFGLVVAKFANERADA